MRREQLDINLSIIMETKLRIYEYEFTVPLVKVRGGEGSWNETTPRRGKTMLRGKYDQGPMAKLT